MKTRIVVRVPVEMLKAIKPAPGQLSMFGGTQPVVVKPHTRTTPSGQAAQVSGYTEQRRSAAEKPHEPRMARLSPERVQQLERLASRKTPVESTPVKEPHEISRLELGTRNVTSMHPKHPLQWEGLDGKLRYADTDEELQKLRSDDFDRHQRLVSRAIRDGKHVPPHVIADYPDLKPNETENPKEPHETTRAEYAKGVTVSRGNNYLAVKGDGGDFVIRSLETSKYSDSDAIGHAHEERIRTALAAGKPVPPHVLADYPDLKPKEPEKPKATTRLTDADRWHRMRNLGVKWPKNRAIPTFPSTMTDEAKREASELHDSMSDQFVSGFGQFEQQRGKLPFRKSLRLVIRKSLVHAYQRRAPSGQSVQVGEYSNKVQKKPTMPSQGHPLWAGASLPPQKPRQPVAPTRAPTRAVVRTRPGTAPPLRPTQAHYKPGLQKPGPSIGETSSGAVIHADSHRVHAGWSKTDHFEAAQAHKDQVAKLERRHQQSDPFEGELGAPAHPDAESEQATAHRARAAYHGRMADGDAKGAAAIAKYDHRFGEHLEGHQAEQHGAATEPAAHDSEKFIADMVTDILAGAQPQGRGGELSVSTQSLHKLPDGTYKPERQAMHKRILEARLAKAVKQDHPEAVFMGGGSASGKGTIQKRGLISLPQGAVVADADMMKTGDPEGQETGTPFRGIPEFGQLSKGGKSDMAAAFVHEESSDLNADLTHACYENGYHVIVDGTGDGSVAKMGKKVAAAKAAGHKVRAIYCTVPTDMAVERSMERAKNTGREVPEKAVRELHAGVSRVFPEVTKLFDDLELWDNTADPKLIYSKKSDRGETVHDPKAYQAFLAKANESSDERYDRASGKVTAMQKAMGGDKRKRVLMVPHEWPDADKRGESLRRLKKMGLHEHSKRKKQPPRKHGRHR